MFADSKTDSDTVDSLHSHTNENRLNVNVKFKMAEKNLKTLSNDLVLRTTELLFAESEIKLEDVRSHFSEPTTNSLKESFAEIQNTVNKELVKTEMTNYINYNFLPINHQEMTENVNKGAILDKINSDFQPSQHSNGTPKTRSRIRGEKSYSCTYCPKLFSERTNVNRHMRTHTGEKPYSCTVCYKSFGTKANLIHHTRTHTGEKPYPCTICGRSFNQQTNLTHHIQTHTGQKPYSCTICYKAFGQKISLARHMRTHSGDNPYAKSRACIDGLLQQHTEEKLYSCTLCDKSFSIKANLTYHIRTHTGEKPYSCPVCDKCFTHKSYYCHHMETHTEKKTYSCTVCNRSFNAKASLLRHIQTMHQIHTETNNAIISNSSNIHSNSDNIC